MNAAQLINATCMEVEYYTPAPIIEAARATMGGIDFDPASSDEANKRVDAFGYCTAGSQVLECRWKGRVFMNHPFGRKEKACLPGCTKDHAHHSFDLFGNAAWINKLLIEYILGHIDQACCITFACTSEKWFQPLLTSPQCFLYPRTNYHLPDGTIKQGVSKGSVVTYLGPNLTAFARAFARLGTVKAPVNVEL